MKLQRLLDIVSRGTAAALCAAVIGACTADADVSNGGEASASDVIIAVPQLSSPRVSTRVALVDDPENPVAGQTVELRWTENDSFLLWAVGENTYGNMRFDYLGNERYPNGDAVLFRSSQVPAMSGDEYTYRAFYPCTEDVDIAGNRLNYEIPTVQNGRIEDGCDIMVSEPLTARAMERDLYTQDFGFVFRHETHALKITVPESSNLFGHEITRIRIEFPQAVAGRLSFDAVTGEVQTDGITERIINVEFDGSMSAGEPFWVFIAPTEISGAVKFTAYGGEAESYMNDPSIAPEGAFGDLAKGHITPVKLGLKEAFPVTWFDYEILDCSRLGEEVAVMHFQLPEGIESADRSEDENSVYTAWPDRNGRFGIPFRSKELEEITAERDIVFAARYESEHAVVDAYADDAEKYYTIAADGYIPDEHQVRTIEYIPYLFEEDFSNIRTFAASGYNPSGNLSTGTGAESLANYNLPGWSAARGAGDAGNAISIAGRTEDGWLSVARYHGRLDSAPLANIKEGATVNVEVSFDCSLGRNKNIGHTPSFAYGVHTDQGVVASKREDNGTLLSNPAADDVTGELDGSFNNIYTHIAYSAECTSLHRLAWDMYTLGRQTGNSNSWLFIDNVKVSIVTE